MKFIKQVLFGRKRQLPSEFDNTRQLLLKINLLLSRLKKNIELDKSTRITLF